MDTTVFRLEGGRIDRLEADSRFKFLTVGKYEERKNTAGLIRAFDAEFRGEGWGLPVGEAMACGLPAIVTNFSGVTEYATSDNALLLDCTLTPAASGCWAEPDEAALRRMMRFCCENRAAARAIGQRAACDMASRWSWDGAAAVACEAIAALLRA